MAPLMPALKLYGTIQAGTAPNVNDCGKTTLDKISSKRLVLSWPSLPGIFQEQRFH